MSDLPSREEVEAHVRETLDRMTRWACQEWGFRSFKLLDLDITFQSNYQRSRAGRGRRDGRQHAYMRLHLWSFITVQSLGHHEYPSFADDLEIGGYVSTDWRLNLDGLIAHELAHCIQHVLPHWSNMKIKSVSELGEWEGNHGPFFQSIYRKLRNKFINHRLEFWQLTPPERIFDVEVRPSALQGYIIRTPSGGRAEVIGLRPRARKHHYLIQMLDNQEYICVDPQTLVEWSGSLVEGVNIDGFEVELKMAA